MSETTYCLDSDVVIWHLRKGERHVRSMLFSRSSRRRDVGLLCPYRRRSGTRRTSRRVGSRPSRSRVHRRSRRRHHRRNVPRSRADAGDAERFRLREGPRTSARSGALTGHHARVPLDVSDRGATAARRDAWSRPKSTDTQRPNGGWDRPGTGTFAGPSVHEKSRGIRAARVAKNGAPDF